MLRLALAFLAILAPLRAEWVFSNAEALAASDGIDFVRRSASDGKRSVALHVVSFRAKSHTFAVMDNPDGDFDLGSASAKRGALAAVNGGYFHPDRTPLGLVVRQGVTIHPLERAKLLSGLVVVKKDRIALLRAAEFRLSKDVREALQAGPFLVDGGKAVAGLNDTRGAARTVVFADDGGNFGFLICKSATLAETARILATPGLLPAGRITRALNLDGGSSTALWVKRDGAPFYSREWKGVRNYLAILPRQRAGG
jgi:Phosphodiester glycosidase